MRAVIQRVRSSTLRIDDAVHAEIGRGVLVLLGVGPKDAAEDAQRLAAKIVQQRIHADDQDRMNLALADLDPCGEMLVVSQFTLFADTRKGHRPSFTAAASPDLANELYERFVAECEALLPGRVRTGVFAADMQIELVNDGPVTIVMDTDEWKERSRRGN